MNRTSSMLKAINSIFGILSQRQKILILVITSLAFVTTLLEMACAGVMVKLTQAIITPDQGGLFLENFGIQVADPHQAIIYIGAILFTIYVCKNIVSIIDVAVQNLGIRRMNCAFQKWLLERFQKIDYEFFKTRHSSYGITVVSGDTDVVFSRGVLSLAAIMTESLVFFGLVAVLAYLNLSLILVLLVLCLAVGVLIVKFGFPFLYALGQKNQEASLQKNINITKYFQGYKEIFLSGKAGYFIDEYLRFLSISTGVTVATNVFGVIPRAIIELIFLGTFVVCLLVVDISQTDLGFLGAYAYTAFRIMPGLNRIINHSANFKSAIPFIQRFSDEYNKLGASSAYIDVPSLEFNKNITFDHVSFVYQESQRCILENINFKINKGDFIGIVGETGAGKSTLLNILLGLLKPTAGEVLVDAQYPVNSMQWHQKIGYVPQSIYLIDGTIEENIAFGHDPASINHDKLLYVIDQAQLSPLLGRLDQGLKTRVGEFGSALSGGEQQRIAIARALYKEPEILVFDEATSALDQDTEARVIETINDFHAGKTIIMIAHRLESLRYCSRIIRIEKNGVQEIGKYENLKGSPSL